MAGIPSRIGTKSRFSLMELPVELRLELYKQLFIYSGPITIPSSTNTSGTQARPAVAILQTCKTVNEEATPVLYSANSFSITLPHPSSNIPVHTLFLSNLRWSTLSLVPCLSFQSNNSVVVPELSSTARPAFTCSGKDIVARFSTRDFKYSPAGPDWYMALSVSNWVSTKVMSAELTAFQVEIDGWMRGESLVTLMTAGNVDGDAGGADATGEA